MKNQINTQSVLFGARTLPSVFSFCSFTSAHTYTDVASTRGDAVNNNCNGRTHFWNEDKTNFMLNEKKEFKHPSSPQIAEVGIT